MGVRASEKGVTLKFLDVTGKTEMRDPVTGEFAFFFGTKRPEAPGDPDPIHGSQDWLTDLIVVDNPAKLIDLRPSQPGISFTSASSKRVTVQWSVGRAEDSMDFCYTISTGHQASSSDPLYADTVLVLPAQTQMVPGHYLFETWKKQAQAIL